MRFISSFGTHLLAGCPQEIGVFIGIPFTADDSTSRIQFHIVVIRYFLDGITFWAVTGVVAGAGFNHIGNIHAYPNHRLALCSPVSFELIVGESRFRHGCFCQCVGINHFLRVEIAVFVSIEGLIPDFVVEGDIQHHAALACTKLVDDGKMPGTGVGIKTIRRFDPPRDRIGFWRFGIATPADKARSTGCICP